MMYMYEIRTWGRLAIKAVVNSGSFSGKIFLPAGGKRANVGVSAEAVDGMISDMPAKIVGRNL